MFEWFPSTNELIQDKERAGETDADDPALAIAFAYDLVTLLFRWVWWLLSLPRVPDFGSAHSNIMEKM